MNSLRGSWLCAGTNPYNWQRPWMNAWRGNMALYGSTRPIVQACPFYAGRTRVSLMGSHIRIQNRNGKHAYRSLELRGLYCKLTDPPCHELYLLLRYSAPTENLLSEGHKTKQLVIAAMGALHFEHCGCSCTCVRESEARTSSNWRCRHQDQNW